ncbi:uncharacterized protein L203_105944 [Cryptococcus depauperatus CBS 7841]|uniref:Uncharacterized protein n=1 Tax=Cryptococcus depauperatus CBS 7841 TaxID=1295531 RepID=A0AAJ8JYI9_9TREE
MVQFTTLAAVVGMPMLVMAGPLQLSRNVSALSPTSHVKRTGATGIVDVVNAVDKRSSDSCPALATTILTITVTATNTNSNGNETPSGSATPTSKSTTTPSDKTSGPLVYYLDPKDPKDLVKQAAINYKDAAGPAQDNGYKSWYAGGFRQAIISLGKKDTKDKKDKRDEKDDKADDGKGVVNGELFKSVENADKEKVAEAGQWGLKYLTGIDVVREDADKDGKDWDTWMEKVCPNPAIILTNDKPANGLEPNKYYTITSHAIEDKTFQLWHSSDPRVKHDIFMKVSAEDLKKSTRYLYHLKDWTKY